MSFAPSRTTTTVSPKRQPPQMRQPPPQQQTNGGGVTVPPRFGSPARLSPLRQQRDHSQQQGGGSSPAPIMAPRNVAAPFAVPAPSVPPPTMASIARSGPSAANTAAPTTSTASSDAPPRYSMVMASQAPLNTTTMSSSSSTSGAPAIPPPPAHPPRRSCSPLRRHADPNNVSGPTVTAAPEVPSSRPQSPRSRPQSPIRAIAAPHPPADATTNANTSATSLSAATAPNGPAAATINNTSFTNANNNSFTSGSYRVPNNSMASPIPTSASAPPQRNLRMPPPPPTTVPSAPSPSAQPTAAIPTETTFAGSPTPNKVMTAPANGSTGPSVPFRVALSPPRTRPGSPLSSTAKGGLPPAAIRPRSDLTPAGAAPTAAAPATQASLEPTVATASPQQQQPTLATQPTAVERLLQEQLAGALTTIDALRDENTGLKQQVTYLTQLLHRFREYGGGPSVASPLGPTSTNATTLGSPVNDMRTPTRGSFSVAAVESIVASPIEMGAMSHGLNASLSLNDNSSAVDAVRKQRAAALRQHADADRGSANFYTPRHLL